jgi:hypothetical protein
MLCAHTVRRLKPGAYVEFKDRFGPSLTTEGASA